MREAFAAALGGFQGLGSDDAREKPVDRLTALAASQIARSKDVERQAALCSLGVDLMRFKDANCAGAKLDAEDKLSAALKWRSKQFKLSGAQRDVIARWAVMEHAIDLCPTCAGAREVPTHAQVVGQQPMKICPTCIGTGKRHYSDSERIEAMGRAFGREMQEAHRLIAEAVSLAHQMGMRMLERWK